MKLFIFTEVYSDYTHGVCIISAKDKEDAYDLLRNDSDYYCDEDSLLQFKESGLIEIPLGRGYKRGIVLERFGGS